MNWIPFVSIQFHLALFCWFSPAQSCWLGGRAKAENRTRIVPSQQVDLVHHWVGGQAFQSSQSARQQPEKNPPRIMTWHTRWAFCFLLAYKKELNKLSVKSPTNSDRTGSEIKHVTAAKRTMKIGKNWTEFSLAFRFHLHEWMRIRHSARVAKVALSEFVEQNEYALALPLDTWKWFPIRCLIHKLEWPHFGCGTERRNETRKRTKIDSFTSS